MKRAELISFYKNIKSQKKKCYQIMILFLLIIYTKIHLEVISTLIKFWYKITKIFWMRSNSKLQSVKRGMK